MRAPKKNKGEKNVKNVAKESMDDNIDEIDDNMEVDDHGGTVSVNEQKREESESDDDDTSGDDGDSKGEDKDEDKDKDEDEDEDMDKEEDEDKATHKEVSGKNDQEAAVNVNTMLGVENSDRAGKTSKAMIRVDDNGEDTTNVVNGECILLFECA